MSIAESTSAGTTENPASEQVGAGMGLRERKRLATSRSIQSAVLELSRDKGLDNVTVDEISRRADISPRTFFNYFSSKEAAVLGESPFTLPAHEVQAFIAAGPDEPLLDGLLGIMRSIADTDSEDFEMHHLRKLVIRDYPHLLVQRITSMREFEIELTSVVSQRLVLDARSSAAHAEIPDQKEIDRRARLITLVAIAAMRHAWASWAESSDAQSMSTLLTRSFRELQTLL